MLLWLLDSFEPIASRLQIHTTGDSPVSLTARAALAVVTSFVTALILGPRAIRWLRLRFRERIDSASDTLNELQASKQQTPTMGGLFVVAAIVVASLLWADLRSGYVHLAVFVAIGYACLGAADDWIKLSSQRRGLSARQKLAGQIALALVAAVWLMRIQAHHPQAAHLVAPVGGLSIALGAWFVPWAVVVVVGSSNGVNLTDGLDGLAGGCMVFAGAAFTALAYLAGHRVLAAYVGMPHFAGAGELSVVLGAMVGAMLGFLWYNCHPAQVFMGDTGSLSLGALLGFSGVAIRQEALLLVIGGVFVVETLSVIAQVLWFRLTGRRLIACSPLHNHFLFKGLQEHTIVVRFWIGGALLALIGVASLKIQ